MLSLWLIYLYPRDARVVQYIFLKKCNPSHKQNRVTTWSSHWMQKCPWQTEPLSGMKVPDWYNGYENWCGVFSKSLKWSSYTTFGHITLNLTTKACSSMFIAVLVTIARKYKWPRCLSNDAWTIKCSFIHSRIII